MSLLSPNLQAFMAIAKLGTVHGAADELGLTQTGITQRIRAIESELGTTLFLRSRKGMKLTQEGEALLRYCNSSEELAGQALSQIRGAGKDSPVYVSVVGPTSIMTARIVDQCASLYEQFPNLNLNFIISDSTDRLNYVRTGQAAMAIVSPEEVPNEMDSKMLKPDRYVLVASPKWKGRKLTEILENERVIDFDETDSTTLNYLKKLGITTALGRSRIYVNSNEAIIKFFCKGVGFGTLTQEIAKPYLESGHLITLNGGSVMEDEQALVWYPRPNIPAYFKSIITCIK